MRFCFDSIEEYISGAEYIERTERGIIPHRFSKAEERAYKELHQGHLEKVYSSAGVKIELSTDASAVKIRLITSKSSSRSFFALDVHADGKYFGSVKNYDVPESLQGDPAQICPLGECSGEVVLESGIKKVKLTLPFSVKSEILEIELVGASFYEPVKNNRKLLLAYGDSITHGYDSFISSNSYINRLADEMGVNVCNKAIGGEIFFPELAEAENAVNPDYITVAYGTNDWSMGDREKTLRDARRFYKVISEKHPDAKIFAITPIWRTDFERDNPFGDFFEVERIIAEITKELSNVVLIRGFDFVPHDKNYYADLFIHPNDDGFAYYATNLAAEIKKYI